MKTLSNGWTIVAASKRTVLAMHPHDGRYAVWTELDDGATVCGEYSNDIAIAASMFDERRAEQ